MQQFDFSPENLAVEIARYNERRAIRRLGNILGFAFSLNVLFGFIFSSLLLLVVSLLGVNPVIVQQILSDPFYAMVYQMLFSFTAMLLPFLIAAKFIKKPVGEMFDFKKTDKKTILPFLLIGFGFLGITNILSGIFSNILNMLGISNYNLEITLPTSFYGFLISTLAVAVTPALLEEFAFRGIFLGSLKGYGEGFCILASSIAFSLMHGNLDQIPFTFLVGLSLGFIAVKTGSAWTAVLLHFINNFCSVVLQYITQSITSVVILNAISIIYYAISVGAAVLGILLLKDGSTEQLKLKKPTNMLNIGGKAAAFFAAPLMILAYILTFVQILITEMLL